MVTVGDLTTRTSATDAVVAAAREAMLNAARHSGDPQPVELFARMAPDEVSVYVRDRGCGFDPDTLPADRGGVRDSIIGRITRAGGTTTIRWPQAPGPRSRSGCPMTNATQPHQPGPVRSGC